MDDPEIVAMVNEVMEEASYGLTREFPITRRRRYVRLLLYQLDSPIMPSCASAGTRPQAGQKRPADRQRHVFI